MLTGVVTFLLLLIALLAVPVTLKFQMSWRQALQGDIRLLWLFGLVRLRLAIPHLKLPSQEAKKATRKISRIERSPRKSKNQFAVIWQRPFRQRMLRFIRDFWHAVHKRDVNLRIRIGLGDPADTGQLWAVVGPAAGMLSNVQEASIEIAPEFFDTTFELDSSGNIRFIPLQMIYLAAALIFSPAVWHGIRQMRKVER